MSRDGFRAALIASIVGLCLWLAAIAAAIELGWL